MSTSKSPTDLGSVLVVGGCGFLGHHIVSILLSSKIYTARISVLDLRTTRNTFPGVSYHSGDITSETSVRDVFAAVQPAVIIHTASPLAIDHLPHSVFEKVNVQGTRTLLECAKLCKSVKAFVYTSSASVVHDSVSNLRNATETLPVLRAPEQREYYSETKGIADELVLAANDPAGILTASIRPASIFGEGDVQMIPNLLATMDSGRTRVQLGDNSYFFDFTYVGNVADAHLLAAAKLLEGHGKQDVEQDSRSRVDGEAFFVTNDQPIPFWDMVRAVWKASGDRTPIEQVRAIPRPVALAIAFLLEWIYWIVFWGKRVPSLTRQKARMASLSRTYDIRKAKERLGYVPRVQMDEAIQRTVDWARKQKVAEKIS